MAISSFQLVFWVSFVVWIELAVGRLTATFAPTPLAVPVPVWSSFRLFRVLHSLFYSPVDRYPLTIAQTIGSTAVKPCHVLCLPPWSKFASTSDARSLFRCAKHEMPWSWRVFFCLLLHVQFALVDQQEESGQPFREPPRESPKGENEIGHSVMSCVTLDSTYHLFYLQKHREKRKHSDPNLPPSHSRLVNHLVVAKWGVLYAYVLLFFAKYDVHKVTLKSWSISSVLISYF